MPTVIIPALNAADSLPRTLDSVRGCAVVVVDGGSTDGTVALAEASGATVLTAPQPGRGLQLALGAEATRDGWLLFLHADTWLQKGWQTAAETFATDPANAERAAYFRLKFESGACQARRVERIVNWRSRDLGLPYGDQGLLIHKRFYTALGGYRPLALMEDVDLVRRIGRKRLVPLPYVAVTSAARYERDGWWLRPMRNIACLALYFLRFPPHLIRRLYG